MDADTTKSEIAARGVPRDEHGHHPHRYDRVLGDVGLLRAALNAWSAHRASSMGATAVTGRSDRMRVLVHAPAPQLKLEPVADLCAPVAVPTTAAMAKNPCVTPS